jgi:uncharacterized membrane protein
MAFCSKCGSSVSEGSAFCSVCGFPVSSAGIPPTSLSTPNAGIASNIAAALAYFVITGIIFLVVDPYKKDKFVRFHSFQAIALWVAVVIVQVVWHMFMSIGFFSLGFFFVIFSLVGSVIWLAIFVYWLFLMYKAYSHETYRIPVIGEWALKQAGIPE